MDPAKENPENAINPQPHQEMNTMRHETNIQPPTLTSDQVEPLSLPNGPQSPEVQPAFQQPMTGQPYISQAPQQPTPPPQPYQVQPAVVLPSAEAPVPTNPGIIVLQWLTYAFWGWTILIMWILTGIVVSSLLNNSDGDTSSVAYAIAGVLVLLPISVICDVFYSKKEPEKKTGASSIVMVIHAVIFALFGIGALIGIVFSIVSLMTSKSGSATAQTFLFSAMLITLLYGAVFVRTIMPMKFSWLRRAFIMLMVVTVGIVAVLGIVGPVANANQTKNDKLIEQNLPSIPEEITTYVQNNDKLPGSLAELELSDDTKQLAESGLVIYKADVKPAYVKKPSTKSSAVVRYPDTESSTTYYYELCATYKKADKSKAGSYADRYSTNGYNETLTAYGHPAGKTCYKMQVVNDLND